MQKICILAFSLLIFLTSLISFATSNVAAANSDAAFAKDLNPTPIIQKSNYELPYPGLLPDNPLYKLRAIRDKIVSFLISDPRRKAEFNLLQADKRLNSGIYLFNSALLNEKKINLALSTISKAENYFEEAIQKIKEAKRQGMETTEMTNKLIDSSKKHQEVLISLVEKAPRNFKASFNRELQRVNDYAKEVTSLTSKRLNKTN